MTDFNAPPPPPPPPPPPNPYSHPDGGYGAQQPRPPLRAGDFSFGDAMSEGFEVFKDNYGALLGAAAIVLGLNIVSSIVTMVLDAAVPLLGTVISWFVSFFVFIPIQVGLQFVGVMASRRVAVSPGDVFCAFPRYLSVLLTSLLVALISIGVMLPVLIVGVAAGFFAGQAGGGVGIVIVAVIFVPLVILLGLYVTARIGFAPAISIDPMWGDIGVLDAIRTSSEMTREQAWSIVGLLVVSWLIATSSVLLLCIGFLLLGWPLQLAIWGAMYRQLTHRYISDSCKSCGYPTAGLMDSTCPECGTPLED